MEHCLESNEIHGLFIKPKTIRYNKLSLHMISTSNHYFWHLCFQKPPTNLSSPLRPLSTASGRSDLKRSWVIAGEPRHRVDNKLITVEMLGFDLASGAMEDVPGVDDADTLWLASPTQCSRCSSSRIRPCLASGAGSIPRRVYRSAREAKHLSAPSATWTLVNNKFKG